MSFYQKNQAHENKVTLKIDCKMCDDCREKCPLRKKFNRFVNDVVFLNNLKDEQEKFIE